MIKFIRVHLLRQKNGIAFARAEPGLQERRVGRLTRGSHFKPKRWVGDPSLYLRRGERAL
jgi:hypothetical protein